MPTIDQTATNDSDSGRPTYDGTLTDLPGAHRAQRATVARHQQSGGFPGWQYLASGQRHRLDRWGALRRSGVHQRAYSFGEGGATCVCGLIVNDDPEVSGRWNDFFSAPGHLNISTAAPARLFIAHGGPYRLEMWCSACGDMAAVPKEVFNKYDEEDFDDLLESFADAHANVCSGQR